MLTARYFEAFQSGAVVCGFRPESREFEAVLDGFPFVDFTSPGAFERNLLRCMRSPGDWRQASIEIQENHTWEKRLQRIVDDYYGQSKA